MPRKAQCSSGSPERVSSSDTSNSFSQDDLSLTLAGSNLHAFTIAELRAVTRNFSMTNVIGSGGFGTVYKGYIDDKLRPGLKAQQVAVKSLDLEGQQGHRDERKINPCLVFVCAGLLASLPWSTRLKITVGAAKGLAFLHEAEKPVIYRDFKASNILIDTVSSLSRLPYHYAFPLTTAAHSTVNLPAKRTRTMSSFSTATVTVDYGLPLSSLDCTLTCSVWVVHELDGSFLYFDPQDYTAKLSDFGLAKDGPQGDNTHVTTRVMGTHGYAAPEYVLTGKSLLHFRFGVLRSNGTMAADSPAIMYPNAGHLTAKSDVYSFGVVLLELLAGRRCVDKSKPTRQKNLVDWARPYLTNADKLRRVMDPGLDGLYSTKGAQKAAAIAYKCLSHNPKSRPEMRTVVEMLEPLLNLDDVPFGAFVYVAPKEEEEKEKVAIQEKNHNNHDERHKQRFPNSVIHSEVTLHKDGRSLYRNSHFRKSQRQNQERGA
ncbi:hypothetical protein B296_00011438 [Ensete ventricosum]|uniref:Protein kinase domain-containing protein n=1 Tax=Ensete ventricosum TaxID=4639 RepID=A0A426YUW9_ENSVE|nr:hypothetical protein B296_00011438 [Ensete ventricosum]